MCRKLNRQSQKYSPKQKMAKNLPCVSCPVKTNGRKNGKTDAEQYCLHNVLPVVFLNCSGIKNLAFPSVEIFYPKKIHMLILGIVFNIN